MIKIAKKAAFLVAIGLVLASCAQPVQEKTYPAFTDAEAQKAFAATSTTIGSGMALAENAGEPKTEGTNMVASASSKDGTISVRIETGPLPKPTQSKVIVTLKNAKDANSDYTLSGSMVMVMKMETKTMELNADIDLSGTGPIQKIVMSASGAMSPGGTPENMTLKINGKAVDPKTFTM